MAKKKTFENNLTPAAMFIEPQTLTVEDVQPQEYTGYEVKSQRIQLVMKPSLVTAAREKAQQQGISFNEYVHRLIAADLKGE